MSSSTRKFDISALEKIRKKDHDRAEAIYHSTATYDCEKAELFENPLSLFIKRLGRFFSKHFRTAISQSFNGRDKT
jgi:hypothetical protein